MIRILATADLHLGEPLKNERYKHLNLPLTMWNHIVELAIKHKAHLLLIAGDLLDHQADFSKVLELLKPGFESLQKAKVEVYMVSGNHDFDLLPDLVFALQMPHIHIMGAGDTWEKKTLNLNGQKITLHGRCFPEFNSTVNPLKDFDISKTDRSKVNIGLLHYDVQYEDSHYGYLAPEKLIETGLDLWILGHVHKPAIISKKPIILYPGAPHEHAPKKNTPNGPILIEVENNIISEPIWMSTT